MWNALAVLDGDNLSGIMETITLRSASSTEGRDKKEAYLRDQQKYPDKGQPARNASEPEPSPPGQQLDDVAVGEDPSARIQSADTKS